MKRSIAIVTLLLVFTCISCETEILYEHDITLKEVDFQKTINGKWQIEHCWFNHLDSIYNKNILLDSVQTLNALYGKKAFLVIDFPRGMRLEWDTAVNEYDLSIFPETAYYQLYSSPKSKGISDTTLVVAYIGKHLTSDIDILLLTNEQLKLRSYGLNIQLIKQ